MGQIDQALLADTQRVFGCLHVRRAGLDKYGFDRNGFDKQGFNIEGYNT